MEPESSLRERLIDVGVDLVTTEGAGSLGLREIARRAGVSHGAPRRYFPTHQALLSAIARRGFAELGARFAAALDRPAPPRARLRAAGRTYVGYALANRGMFELMFRHDLLAGDVPAGDPPDGGQGRVTGADPADGHRPLRESTRPLFALLTALVADHLAATGRQPGRPGAPDPALAAAALWTNLHGIAQLWTWGSLQLVLDTAPPPGRAPAPDDPSALLDRLLDAALDAHLGPADA
ncbi:TetR/AcrR family transcriptional regulator [Kitasatospora sp. NPDC048540]|uniref:TetR/AcrR family transcriptional regulator n=1 Tax=Kitasatospora sp. NPDC048540 TaxID=3155634 RepID=UPI0033D7BAAC